MATTADQKIDTHGKFATLSVGDAVLVTQDGKTTACHVVRIAPPGSTGRSVLAGHIITVGFGPGRWNREVDLATIQAGFVKLERG